MARLFDPIKIGPLNLKNRLVLPPMRSRKASEDGMVTEELINHYKTLSEGPGLVIVEHAFVAEGGRLRLQLGISNDRYIPGLRMLVEAIQNKGAAVVLQLSHAGSLADPDIIGGRPIAPSPVKNPRSEAEEVPREMTKKDMEDLISAYEDAAKRAFAAGFDGVEVHCAHGFLLSEFMSPITNLRRDEYGGRPENRIRLAVDIVKAIKRRVGSTYPVLCRIGARDFIQGGLEIDESIVMARSLLEAGVDVIDVAGGLGGIEPPENRGQGYLIPEAEAIKRATGATVIGVGGITDCRFADKVIREGKVDLVAVGRAMLRDPRWCLNALRTISQGET